MAFRSLALSVGFLMILWGCGEDPGGPRISGGSSGSGGSAGSGGSGGMVGTGGTGGCLFGCGGSGGTSGSGGTGGTGGTAGSGGSGGSGGTAGTAGSGGSGGSAGGGGAGGGEDCVTWGFCTDCPADPCETNNDCAVGEVCAASGCETQEGDSIMQCWPAPGGACITNADCAAEYECVSVGFGKSKCVKTTPGCNSDNDCVLGFSCEGVPGSCVDRRLPCDDYVDCPKSHVCAAVLNIEFCLRVNRGCQSHDDCSDVGAFWCVDIDGDGSTECAGTPNPNDVPPAPACVNSDCGGATPVCESAAVSSSATCGQYGLCLDNGDCAAGFECVGLWPDGRKECVEIGGTCNDISDCPEQQVCASPWLGGSPSCQSGSAP